MGAADPRAPLPKVAEVLGQVLLRVPAAQRPLLVALAERLAAERYRGWAALVESPAQRASLLACAEREERIAGLVESLHADAAGEQRRLLAANPDLLEINRALFAERPLAQQFALQAEGERAGAALWRAVAAQAAGQRDREAYLACASLEEESATYLESLARS
jgi:hypothetical protein